MARGGRFWHEGRSWSGPDPKGGGGRTPPLRTPKLSYGTMCFVGAGGAGDFVLGIRQGEIFLFNPVCLYSKYSEFRGEFKNGGKAQKRILTLTRPPGRTLADGSLFER